MICKNGLTLLEILIIIIILGILAAVIIPQFTEANTEARASALISDLRKVRAQVELYKFQHNGQFPAATGETSADFERRITTSTNADGNAGSDNGPYLKCIPVNCFNGLSTVRIDGAPAGANADGWRFDTATGTFQADDSIEHAAF